MGDQSAGTEDEWTSRTDLPDVQGELTAVSLDDPRAFVTAALRVFVDRWNLEAASLFLFTPESRTLRLKAQVGFAYEDYAHFEFPQASFPGLAVTKRQPVICANPSGSEYFINKVHLERHPRIAGVVSLPLILPPGPPEVKGVVATPDPMGALSLYPREPADLDALARRALEYGPFLARLYTSTLERHAMTFRQATIREVAFSEDALRLARSFTNLVRAEVSVDACSLWLVDARLNELYLKHGTSTREEVPPFSLTNPNERDPIVRCFLGARSVFRGDPDVSLKGDPSGETLKRPLHNAAWFPLLLPSSAQLNGRTVPVAGVLALYNHFTAYGEANHLTEFSWEDRFLAEFACEMVAVLVYQVLRTRDYESDFERLMHGVRTGLQAARTRLQFLDQNEIGRLLPGRHKHYIPNAIDWIEDLEAQINRDEMVGADDLAIEDVALYGSVLAKLSPMTMGMKERYGVADIVVEGLDYLAGNFRAVPRVRGNRRALDCVFRNLLENCMKYAEPSRKGGSRIHIGVESSRASVIARVEDNGIGIPGEERDSVFREGYRGDTARARRPQGRGRGLHECHVLMERMAGEIRVVEPVLYPKGTAFEVIMQRARKKGQAG